METNSKKLLEAIPDFRDFMDLAEEIRNLSYRKMVMEKDIKEVESLTFNTVMTDEQYFVNGKSVPVSYFEHAYKAKGIDGSLPNMREILAEITADLELKRTQYDIYKQMLEVWRTQSANERVIS